MYYVRMQLLDRPHHNFMMVPVSPEGFITLIVLRRYFNGAIGVHFYNIYRELVTVTKAYLIIIEFCPIPPTTTRD